MPDRPPIDLKNASTGDPLQQEKTPPPNMIEAIDRRTIRQTIITQLLSEIANEIIQSGTSLNGTLREAYNQHKLPRLRALITDTETQFNNIRDKLYVGRDFGSINLVVFRNAMAIGENDVDPEEVAKRVVIRVGLSGGYRDRKFAGCK
jgi:hypothetical protein